MTDLMEMVDWLRGVATGDLAKARAAALEIATMNMPGALVEEDPDGCADQWARWSVKPWLFKQQVFAEQVDGKGWRPQEIATVGAEHIATHDPRDTIARCEAELEIIERAGFLGDRAKRVGDLASSTVITDGRYRVLEDGVRPLAYGYRNRPGWKDSWKS